MCGPAASGSRSDGGTRQSSPRPAMPGEMTQEDAGLSALLVRLFMREGSMLKVAESYERDFGRPLIASPDLLRRAEQGALRILGSLREMDAATDGTGRERGDYE